jgi:hypothetical protein
MFFLQISDDIKQIDIHNFRFFFQKIEAIESLENVMINNQ